MPDFSPERGHFGVIFFDKCRHFWTLHKNAFLHKNVTGCTKTPDWQDVGMADEKLPDSLQ